MKVLLVFAPLQRLSSVSMIQTEIILSHLNNGDELHILGCNEEQPTCYLNPEHKKNICIRCRCMQEKIMLTVGNEKVKTLQYKKELFGKASYSFEHIDDLKSFQYRDIRIGMGVASTLISRVRDHKPDLKKHADAINRDINASKAILDTFIEHNANVKPQLVYVFNGRSFSQFPIVDYCRKKNIDFKTFEFGNQPNTYRLIHKTIPHDLEYVHAEMTRLWNDEANDELKIKKGSSFFEKTREGHKFLENSFITYQKSGFLPDEIISTSKKIITFYNSSIDEYASVPGWEKHIFFFKDECEAISKICKHYQNDDSKIFVLRVHPNLKFLDNTQTRALNQLKSLANLVFIPPESKVSTYALMDISDQVITFGSTIGVEAAYWGKPSVLLGLSFYMHLNVSYVPKSMQELLSLIDATLRPLPKENAIKYGYWWTNFGKKFDFVKESSAIQKSFYFSKPVLLKSLLYKAFEADWGYVIKTIFSKKLYKKLADKNVRAWLLKELQIWYK